MGIEPERRYEYLFLDLEWNQKAGTTDLLNREPVQIGILGTDEHLKQKTLFSRGIRLEDEREEFVTALWEDFLSETSFVCSVYKRDTSEYLGYCSIKDITRENLEVAIELMPEFCHKGYGTESLTLLMENINRLTGRRYFRARVAIDNYESQGLMKKLGAVPNGVSEFLLHGDAIEEFKEAHKAELTDEIRAVAKEFGMNAEDIIGYVLEYRLDVGKE